jgi:hypothetical protein
MRKALHVVLINRHVSEISKYRRNTAVTSFAAKSKKRLQNFKWILGARVSCGYKVL